ncbi:MAG: hypothetical protein M3Y30_02370 [Gemmatimonadota bacterium]|nr:hypothetical protein [Gemmatimonadota bacterium]
MQLPIACTLGPDDFAKRLRWIAELNRAYLRAHAIEGRVMELSYAPAAAGLLAELVRRESECCAFLRFDLEQVDGDVVRLRITAPEEARASASMLLSPFLEGS